MKGRHGRYKLHGARSPTRGQHGPRKQRPSWVSSAREWQLRSSPRSVDWIVRPSSGFSSLAGAGGERRRDLERAGGVSVGVRGGRENSVPPHFASNLRGIPPTFYGEHAASARARAGPSAASMTSTIFCSDPSAVERSSVAVSRAPSTPG